MRVLGALSVLVLAYFPLLAEAQPTSPSVMADPSRIPLGITTIISLTVRVTRDGAFASGAEVFLCGSPIGGSSSPPSTMSEPASGCTGATKTDDSGSAFISVVPFNTGDLFVYVNNERTIKIAVFAGLALLVSPSSPVDGDRVIITTFQAGRGSPESGVTLSVTREPGGQTVTTFTTGSDGRLYLPGIHSDNYRVVGTKAGFENSYVNFTVSPRLPPPPPGWMFELNNLVVPPTATVGQSVNVHVSATNRGSADNSVMVELFVDGVPSGSQYVRAAAGANTTAIFAFTPQAAGVFQVTAKLPDGSPLSPMRVTVKAPAVTSPSPTTPTSLPTVTTPATRITTMIPASPTEPSQQTATNAPPPAWWSNAETAILDEALIVGVGIATVGLRIWAKRKRPVEHNGDSPSKAPSVRRSHFLATLPQTDRSITPPIAVQQTEASPTAPGDDRLRVFLCHSSKDKDHVAGLYLRLRNEGFQPWFDKENLIAGQNWRIVIPEAIRNSHVVIVFLSKTSVNRAGYAQKEIRSALDVADEQPPGSIFIIPARLELCDLPMGLRDLHRVDLYEPDGYDRLVLALLAREQQRATSRFS